MAALTGATRLSARILSRHGQRTFRTSAISHAAQNFAMPAMSPTMTEGNIGTWKVKEGDSYAAGDVLLEIETDKAQMDVEAQDDGIVAKITQQDGTKSVKVGQRIAVLAEPGDDLSSLEIPAEEESKQAGQPARKDRPSPQEELKGGIDTTESSESAAEGPPSSKPNADADAGGAADTAKAASGQQQKGGETEAKVQKQRYPFYPSVQFLLHEKGLTREDADKIPSSGPNGRLLKGDVLAYMGRIEKNYSYEQSQRLKKLGHLDLSNIKLAETKKPQPKKEVAQEAKTAPPSDTEIAVPISLSAVIATQKRVQDTLGIFLPLSTFIARASELANESLPLSKHRQPTSDELFASILGADKVVVGKTSRGRYTPQITALGPTPIVSPVARATRSDIIDMLTSTKSNAGTRKAAAPRIAGAAGIAAADNVFSVTARNGEEKRAQEYLGRMKLVLEGEPGRLVL